MLIMRVQAPDGRVKHIAAAFPSACGKTNFAMLQPPAAMSAAGWKVTTIGDDIAWMRFDSNGQLRAINPENGFFGVAPGTSAKTNPAALASAAANSIFTNVAMTPEGDVWWEGMTKTPPPHLISWTRKDWFAGSSSEDAAHPNSRFTAPAAQCPCIDPSWEDPAGVPIDAIIFGGRRSDTVPLVSESLDWQHGVFQGATLMSETTAAAEGQRGALRSDPFAMRPFCGYNMADYFAHWLDMGNGKAAGRDASDLKLPKIFTVNWFRKGADGKFMWPGFGDNLRVVQWIMDRCDNKAVPSIHTPIGILPDVSKGGLNVEGLDVAPQALQQLFEVNPRVWQGELARTGEFLKTFGDRLPPALQAVQEKLQERVAAASHA